MYHAAIDQYKSRGINVATYNDPSSNSIFLEVMALVLLLAFLNSLIFAKFWYISKHIEKQAEVEADADAEADCSQSKNRRSTFIKYFGDIYHQLNEYLSCRSTNTLIYMFFVI